MQCSSEIICACFSLATTTSSSSSSSSSCSSIFFSPSAEVGVLGGADVFSKLTPQTPHILSVISKGENSSHSVCLMQNILSLFKRFLKIMERRNFSKTCPALVCFFCFWNSATCCWKRALSSALTSSSCQHKHQTHTCQHKQPVTVLSTQTTSHTPVNTNHQSHSCQHKPSVTLLSTQTISNIPVTTKKVHCRSGCLGRYRHLLKTYTKNTTHPVRDYKGENSSRPICIMQNILHLFKRFMKIMEWKKLSRTCPALVCSFCFKPPVTLLSTQTTSHTPDNTNHQSHS